MIKRKKNLIVWDHFFHGTLVNITLNCNEKSYYELPYDKAIKEKGVTMIKINVLNEVGDICIDQEDGQKFTI